LNTTRPAVAPAASDLDKTVAEYLRQHPEFFVEHPEVLAHLEIPHASGRAVSLLERQVATLREHNRALKEKFDEIIAIARDNEDLSRRLHRLTLRVLRAPDVREALATLAEGLQADVHADRVVVRVFAAGDARAAGAAEFVGPEAPERHLFADVLAARRPVCGRLKRLQHEALFEPGAAELGSAVVLPLGGRGWDGVLVIASRDARRYHADLGLDLLGHLADVASLVIAARVRLTGP